MEAIIISGLPATGKTTVAKIIGKRLNIRVLGGNEILQEMALAKGYKLDGDEWWDSPQGIKFLRERAENPNFDNETDRLLIKIAEKGDVVMTSYTMPWLAKVGFKIWLAANINNREKRMAERDRTTVKEAADVIKVRDRENEELYEKLYGILLGKDKKPFDLVLDVNKITAEEAAELIIKKEKEKAALQQN